MYWPSPASETRITGWFPNHTFKQQEHTMDYEGQKLAELIFYWIFLSFGAVGWTIGYIRQDFTVVFQVWLAALVLSVIVSRHRGFILCLLLLLLFQRLTLCV